MNKKTQRKLLKPIRMSEEEYRSNPAVNKSTLWELAKSPKHYRYIMENPQQDTPALKIGRAVHAAVLQPEEFKTEYISAPDVDRRTKEGREIYAAFVTAAEGKTVLSASDFEEACSIAAAVKDCEQAVELLTGCVFEKPLFWNHEETGLPCKCRVDAMKPGIMIDLKTSSDASTDAFTKEVFWRGYDVQAAHYMDAYNVLFGSFPDWYFIVVEKSPPYVVNVLHADTGVIDYGFIRRDSLLSRLKDCKDSDSWEGYGKNDLILPGYMEVG